MGISKNFRFERFPRCLTNAYSGVILKEQDRLLWKNVITYMITPPPVGIKLSILPYFLKAFVHYSPAIDGYTNSAFRNTILVLVTIMEKALFE